MTKKTLLLTLAFFLFPLMAATAGTDYPNELEGFKLYGKYCSGLEPMKSTVADVKKVLGNPLENKSGKFVLWYKKDGWNVLVYIYPDSLQLRVTENDLEVRVNGKAVFSEKGHYDLSEKSTFAVKSYDSDVEVKSFMVVPVK